MRKFTFQKAYEELEINGTPYTFDFSDEAVLKYQKAFNVFSKKQKELETKDENSEGYVEDAKKLVKDVVECILGEGTFEKIYIESGKSLYNMTYLLEELSNIIGEKANSVRERNREKYVKK